MADQSPSQPGRMPRWISEHVPEELARSSIFRYDIVLPDQRKITVDLAPDLDIDINLLDLQMEECPSQYMWYGSLYSELRCMVAIFERKIKAHRGVITDELIRISTEQGARLTADQVKAIVERDESLNQLEVELAVVQKHVGKLFHMLTALTMKSELMRSLSSIRKMEIESHRQR